MNKIDEYNKYLKKCEMLGTKMFKFRVEERVKTITITEYFPNNEPERLLNIPDFVDIIEWRTFIGVKQRIKIVANNLRGIDFCAYDGDYIDLSNVNTEGIKDMELMFGECRRLKEINLSKFNTCNVNKMSSMFFKCERLEKLDLRSFDASHVKYMDSMFEGCINMKELDLSSFNTIKLSKVILMFKNCNSLEKLDISNFDAGNLKDRHNREGMFSGCDNLKIIITNENTKEWLIMHKRDIKLPDDVKIQVR